MITREISDEIVARLEKEYHLAECTLDYNEAYELLVEVRLAAQCTDKRVNEVVPALFAKYPTAEAMSKADIEDVEKYIDLAMNKRLTKEQNEPLAMALAKHYNDTCSNELLLMDMEVFAQVCRSIDEKTF